MPESAIFRVTRGGGVVARIEAESRGAALLVILQHAILAAAEASPVRVEEWVPERRRYEALKPAA